MDEIKAGYIRNFVFGVEDSLVSTVGLLSGIAAAGISQQSILLTGSVLVCVEAFSMGVGSFLSESSAEEYVEHRASDPRRSIMDAAIMFFSYIAAGLIPLFPYVIFSHDTAIAVSIAASISALFVLGAAGASISKVGIARGGLRMMLVGGAAIAVGIMVGKLIQGA